MNTYPLGRPSGNRVNLCRLRDRAGKPVEETALLDASERALALSSDPAPTRP